MNARTFDNMYNTSSYIHCIIDFWVTDNEFEGFKNAYNRTPFVCISSKEAYDYLVKKQYGHPFFHLPLSLSDKYSITPNTSYEKDIDLVLFGRQNPKLMEWTKQYASNHPEFLYAYRIFENGHPNYYTNKGDFIADCSSRDEVLKLLRRSKAGLYTTPSMDNNKQGTNGYNQVTPRFLELLSCGCHIISRYIDNPDTDFFELSEFCPNTVSYNHYEEQMDNALNRPVDMVKYSNYLAKHYTSTRVIMLSEILNEMSL